MPARSETTSPPIVRIIGRAGSPMAYTIRDFLYRSDLPRLTPLDWVVWAVSACCSPGISIPTHDRRGLTPPGAFGNSTQGDETTWEVEGGLPWRASLTTCK